MCLLIDLLLFLKFTFPKFMQTTFEFELWRSEVGFFDWQKKKLSHSPTDSAQGLINAERLDFRWILGIEMLSKRPECLIVFHFRSPSSWWSSSPTRHMLLILFQSIYISNYFIRSKINNEFTFPESVCLATSVTRQKSQLLPGLFIVGVVYEQLTSSRWNWRQNA